MSTLQTLQITTPAPHVRLVTLNRPEAANAFNTRMAQELTAAMASVPATGAKGAEELRCIILTGAGTRAFCAGADLKERDGMSDAQWTAQHVIFEKMFFSLMDCPIPLIAAVNGAAFGGGCEIVLACDFVYAARTARFALPETGLGIMPGGAATQNLPRAVGLPRAKEIVFSAAPFTADEAASWGMVNRVLAPHDLMEPVMETASRIAQNGPLAVRQAKRAMKGAFSPQMHAAYSAELEAYNALVPTEDRREGVRAFNEKRKPLFKGR
jgi:enoyl-CoA hydratase/carnithine racemase